MARTDAKAAKPADFDSATVMAAAGARFLAGQGFLPVLGKPYGQLLRPQLVGLDRLPGPARRWLYRVGSGREGLPPDVVAGADTDGLAHTVTERFPPRRPSLSQTPAVDAVRPRPSPR